MQGKRILILNWRDLGHPEGGGSELYVQQVARRWADQGAHVSLFCAAYADAPARESREGLHFVRHGGHITVYLWAALYLLTRRFGRLDAVLEVQNGMPFLARLFTSTPVVVLVHHVHREQWPVVGPVLARVGWFLESRVAVAVNRGRPYVAVSEVTRAELADLGVEARHIAVAYNGMPDRPEFTRDPVSAGPTVVVLSRLVPHKQVEHAIYAVAQLSADFPDLRLDIMGSGWWSQTLAELVTDLGLDDRVRLMGHVTESTKFATLARGWVHLLPSLKEGWGLAIIEAASVGVPSIAYASAGGVQESILDGVTGLLAGNQAEFTALTGQLLADEQLRRDLGTKAAFRAEHFSWDATATKVAQVMLDSTR